MWQCCALLLLGPGVVSGFEWSAGSYYIAPSSLPSPGTSTCCGTDLIGDPTLGTGGPICLCDLTAGQCDTGCCCDLDCSYDALKVGGYFGCTSNGTTTTRVGYTVCSDQVVATNIPEHVRDSGLVSAFGGADGLLCIVSDNSPARGAFFRDPISTTALSDAQVRNEIEASLPVQFSTWLAPPPPDAVVASFYTLGDSVEGNGCVSASSSAGCASRAPVILPAVGLDGGCSGQQHLPFLTDVPSFTCKLDTPGATLADLCGTLLNASFISRASFSRTPSAEPELAAVAYEIDLGNSSGFAASSSPPESSVYDINTGTCSNALLLYQLKVTVGTVGTVDGVTMYLRLGTLTETTWLQASPMYGAGFEYEDAGDQVRRTSGRPGYQRGLPILIADGTSVRSGGLQILPRGAMGACGSGSSGASTVVFGESFAATCSQQMSADDLEAYCVGAPSVDQQPLFAALNYSSTTKVGVYGDSHPENPEDWVALKLEYPDRGGPENLRPQWNARDQKCTNVLSGINLRLLVTDIGSVTNPVTKVVGAELILTRQTINVARCALGVHQCNTVVSVTATATFARLDTESFEFIPDSPQIIPPLPSDFFYPFFVG